MAAQGSRPGGGQAAGATGRKKGGSGVMASFFDLEVSLRLRLSWRRLKLKLYVMFDKAPKAPKRAPQLHAGQAGGLA
jgi:hypothetical protein